MRQLKAIVLTVLLSLALAATTPTPRAVPTTRPAPTSFDSTYLYRAKVVHVHDGDTATCEIQLGLHIVIQDRIARFYGINAPELKVGGRDNPAGLAAAAYARDRLEGKDVLIQTIKDGDDKYGRLLVVIFVRDGTRIVNVNDEMVARGLAVPYYP
jgi:endonuclease YncB( thermonuclease family)